jgi:predicted RNase H-like HicB family nuclease
MLKNDRYTYRVTWSEEDEEYVGLCAEFPSLSWLEPSPEEALKGIRQGSPSFMYMLTTTRR